MMINPVDGGSAAAGPRGGAQRKPTAWLRRLGAGGRGAPQSAQTARVEELEVEMALLREENARLKVRRQRARDRPVHERVRELLPVQEEDEPWELLTDCLLLRNDLLDACREIEQGVRETRRRLEASQPTREPVHRRDAMRDQAAPTGLESAA